MAKTSVAEQTVNESELELVSKVLEEQSVRLEAAIDTLNKLRDGGEKTWNRLTVIDERLLAVEKDAILTETSGLRLPPEVYAGLSPGELFQGVLATTLTAMIQNTPTIIRNDRGSSARQRFCGDVVDIALEMMEVLASRMPRLTSKE